MVGDRPSRFRSPSIRYRSAALSAARDGQWDRVEELLWGSAVAEIKAVATSKGERLEDENDVRRYVSRVAGEVGDRSLEEVLANVGRVGPVHLSGPGLHR